MIHNIKWNNFIESIIKYVNRCTDRWYKMTKGYLQTIWFETWLSSWTGARMLKIRSCHSADPAATGDTRDCDWQLTVTTMMPITDPWEFESTPYNDILQNIYYVKDMWNGQKQLRYMWFNSSYSLIREIPLGRSNRENLVLRHAGKFYWSINIWC